MTALFACSALRLDLNGAALIDGLTCSASSTRLALLGAWEPLFAYAAGRARLASGTALVLGMPMRDAIRSGRAGIALAEIALPSAWSVTEYLRESARLAGLSPSDSKRRAAEVIARIELGPLAKRKLSALAPFEARLLQLAQALLTNPEVLLVDRPFHDLDDRALGFMAQALDRASHDRKLAWSSARMPLAGPERNYFDRMAEVLVLERGELSAQGAPAEVLATTSSYRVTVLRNASALSGLLEARGCQVRSESAGPASDANDRAHRLAVRLPEGATTDVIVACAIEADAPVVELLPSSGVLSG